MNKYHVLLIASGFATLTACDAGVDSPRGFSLPKGDLANGEKVLIKHHCLACHTIKGVTDESVELELDKAVQLGGERSKVTTYAELVTSIINPSHKIARSYKLSTADNTDVSKMRNYNDVMTVTELVDLVTYLQPHFKVKPPMYTDYGRYY